jgi:hypothetical protein
MTTMYYIGLDVPGVHADVGGGYAESETGLSKITLSGC